MDNSSKAIPKILEHEGGYVNHPSDPGGATNKGITLATFRRYIKPNGTVADLKALTTAQAVAVYKRQYWDAVSADLLPSGVDYAVADFAVNSGPSRAAKYLQAVVGVTQDGQIGPATIAATKAMPPRVVIERLCDDRLAFMKRIQGGKLWQTFGRGWQRRVDDVRAVSLSWAAQAPVDHVAPPTPATPPQRSLWAALASLLAGFFGKDKA
ncbi:MAG: glycoside hydrolase family 108 protein [Parasphingorhabdus sp.]